METKDIIYELRTKKGFHKKNLQKKCLLLVRRFLDGKQAKRHQISIHSSSFQNCLTCRSTRSSALRENSSANVVECLLRTVLRAEKLMAISMRNTVNGVMPTVNLRLIFGNDMPKLVEKKSLKNSSDN